MAEQEQNKPKRRIRAATVESVREKTVKSSEQEGRATRKSLIWRGFTAPIRFIGRTFCAIGRLTPFLQIGHGIMRFVRTKPMRILAKILLIGYFRNSWRELRLVTWPGGRESRQLTTAVILFATIFGVLVALVDFGLDKLTKQVLLK